MICIARALHGATALAIPQPRQTTKYCLLSIDPDFGHRQQFTQKIAPLSPTLGASQQGWELTAEQEKSWPVLEQAYRALAATRGKRAQLRADSVWGEDDWERAENVMRHKPS